LPLAAQESPAKTVLLHEDGKAIKITALHKGHNGYIYTGSANGLYLFDGTANFKKIAVADSVVKAGVSAIYEATNGELWVGFDNGAVATGNGRSLRLYSPEEGTPKVAVTCFLKDAHGQLWFGTNGEGIYYTQGKRLYNLDEEDGLSDRNIHALALAGNGEVLAATDQGINICQIDGAKKRIQVLTTVHGLPDNLVTCLAAAGDNRFWVGLQDGGYCRYNHHNRQFELASKGWAHGQINAAATTHHALWLATDRHGLLRVNPQQLGQGPAPGSAVVLAPVFATTLPITGLVFDNEGNGWLSTGNSLVRTGGERLQWMPRPAEADFATTHALLTDREGNIWLGGRQGLVQYQPATGRYCSVPMPWLGPSNVITALYQENSGTIWVGTMGKGVFLLNPATNTYRPLPGVPPPTNRSVLSISGRGQEVFISSLEGVLAATVPANGGPCHFTDYAGAGNIGNSYVYHVFKDSRGRIWLSTFGSGVTLLHNGRHQTFNKSNGLPSDIVYAATEDKKGHIWFSTGDAGICRYDGQGFVAYGTEQGLSSLSILGVKTDALGRVVAIHPDGLDIMDPATGLIGHIGAGLGIGKVNADDLGCVAQDSSGAIYFSTLGGIVRYQALPGLALQPQTLIESVQLLLQDLGPNPRQRFSHDEDNFTFHFNGLYYSDPAQVQYQYKLEGYNTNWVFTKNRDAPFPKLPPGDYVFRVRSSLNGQFAQASEAVYAFTVAQPFWKTWWFIACCVLVGAGLLYWYIKSREKNLTNVERLRQEKIQFQFEVLRNQVNPHFLFNSFNTLITTIEENPQAAVGYVEQLSDFFRNIVNYRDKDLISLQEELDLLQTYYYLQQQRYGDHLQLKVGLPDQLAAEIYIPPLTLQLLMENAIKHNAVSRESPLTVEVSTDDKGHVVVQNNINPRLHKAAGAGMGLQNIMNRYGLLSQQQVQVTHTGQQFIVRLPILKK
jgi:ligand-binding sensor domain-containing protein